VNKIYIEIASALMSAATAMAAGDNRKDTLKVSMTDTIPEVVVTAQETHALTSSSRIAKHAMEHLQPSSFADLLELLPGGRAKDPSLSAPNTISIREVPISNGNYSTSSLGTKFVVDGAPISTNANMQYVSGAYDTQTTYRDFTNQGVDMRTISTDDIENVEIVRGIPSVEYGDLTSGLVKIERRKGGNDITARFKADMDTKLFYLSKAFEWKPKRMSLNISADYLDNKSDPRNLLETYSRLTISTRLNKAWLNDKRKLELSAIFDYGGSFDDDKVDPELNYGGVDKYKSEYNRYAINLSLHWKNMRMGMPLLKEANLTVASSIDKDKTSRTRLVQLSDDTPAATSRENGEAEAMLIQPYTYTATHTVDGKPFNAFAKATATLQLPLSKIGNTTLVGIDWQMDKNYGKGQIYDLMNPLYPGVSERPRKYSDIPASHALSSYIEEHITAHIGGNSLELQAGVRANTMLNLDSRYYLSGKVYLDPRVNAGWTFPAIKIGKQNLVFGITGGYGEHTKTPTMSQLYPDNEYMDLVELNYYHPNKDYRMIYMQTYVINPTNYQLKAARNRKWEIRGDVSYAGNRLSVTYFREDMRSGFRSTTFYDPYTYKTYDASSIDANALTGKPDITLLPYTENQELRGYSKYTNGSRTLKKGIEFTMATKRFPVILTRLTITGAWFKTQYKNSQPYIYKPSIVISGKEYKYAGVYKDDDGYIRELMNTNFTFDTDIPKLKLGFSVSAQCQWFTASESMAKDNMPSQYIDETGAYHDFTEECAQDYYLKNLVRHYNDAQFERQTVPFSMNLNMKATKKLFADKLMLALFVNKLWDAHPDYTRNGYTIRRYVTPYFGLEMNMKL
jgi:hypothetical protein